VPDGNTHPVAAHACGFDHGARPVEIGNIEVEAHAEGVYPITRFEYQGSIEMVDADQTSTTGTMIICNVG
jgi:hypothetical protein